MIYTVQVIQVTPFYADEGALVETLHVASSDKQTHMTRCHHFFFQKMSFITFFFKFQSSTFHFVMQILKMNLSMSLILKDNILVALRKYLIRCQRAGRPTETIFITTFHLLDFHRTDGIISDNKLDHWSNVVGTKIAIMILFKIKFMILFKLEEKNRARSQKPVESRDPNLVIMFFLNINSKPQFLCQISVNVCSAKY